MRAGIQSPALLLQARDKGDDDRLVTLLTPEQGRLNALARHARGSKRRFGAALQPFCLIHAALRPSAGGLYFLEEAQAQEFPLGTQPSLAAMDSGWLFLELANELCPLGQPQAAFFELVLGGLRRLGRGAEAIAAVRLSVLWSALALEGWAPDAEACVRCGEIKPLVGLSPIADGGLCKDCWRPVDGPQDGPAAGVAWLAAAQGRPVLTVPPGAEEALLRWVAHHSGRALKSPQLGLGGLL